MFLEKGRALTSRYELRTADGRVVASTVELAVTRATRRQGLLGRSGLPESHAIVIAPCSAIHTWFMRFPIDVVFVSRDGLIIKTRPSIPAWRMSGAMGAHAAIEMGSGGLAPLRLKPGDRLELVERRSA